MKTDYNEAPWRVEVYDDYTNIENKYYTIATDVANCDAHLIAAAPEMLEALKIAYQNMEHRKGDCYSNDYMGACCCGKDVVKEAIAKAEGR